MTTTPNVEQLRAAGIGDPQRALSFLADLPGRGDTWIDTLGGVADPDLALLQSLRLHEAAPTLLPRLLEAEGEAFRRLVATLGASQFLGDYMIADPTSVEGLTATPAQPSLLLEAVGATPTASGALVAAPEASVDDMRRAYRLVQLGIVADDLTCPDPTGFMPEVGQRMASLADASLEAGLALARRAHDPNGLIPFAVIAMGKTGARELNYISDVDVLYVTEIPDDADERDTLEIARRLATHTAAACSGAGSQPPLWSVDANLRPEGSQGALVRTIDSYRSYWDKWAQTWEFQALLKARFSAGTADLGRAFEKAAAPYVWSASSRDGFVEATQAMRTRVENNIARAHASRELKLGRGGLRDVEFTAQLLQLVHGRTDETLRVRSTTDAIDALSEGGYIARNDATTLRQCYAFLRAIEHRTQLPRMHRTHLIPEKENELRTLARAMNPAHYADPHSLMDALNEARARVRALHEDVYYRPIIAATASLSPDEAALSMEGARDRLAAIGYRDPAGALRHIAALTHGTSRRAAIQRHLLPVFISWLSQGADPDLGLLNFRVLSDDIGDSHWYLALLRDSGVAAHRLTSMLPNSRWIAQALSQRPEAVAWLDSDEELTPRNPQRLHREITSLINRHNDSDEAAARVRAVRTRELTRAAMHDLLTHITTRTTAIANATDAALLGALDIAQREETEKWGAPRTTITLIAMGRYGGRECSYASDADIIALHHPALAATEAEAAASATTIMNRVKALCGTTTNQLSITVDLGLRPEGKNGPLTRTPESLHDYYQRWASTWERHALLRARPITEATPDLLATLDDIRYRGVNEEEVRDIRLLKARMENERLPRAIDPTRHVKLGPGGLSDVEWTIQLIQLRHAHNYTELRTTSTIDAFEAARLHGLLTPTQARTLTQAWELASRIRAANVLATGRMSGVKLDVLPRATDAAPIAHILGYGTNGGGQLEEDWLRAARRARAVMEEKFWEQ